MAQETLKSQPSELIALGETNGPIKIKDGPNEEDLFDTMRLRLSIPAEFCFEKAYKYTRPFINSTRFSPRITAIRRDPNALVHHKSQEWIIEGWTCECGEIFFFTATYNTQTREGLFYFRTELNPSPSKETLAERKARALWIAIEYIMTRHQNYSKQDEGFWKLFETAKKVSQAKDEQAFQDALKWFDNPPIL